MKRVRRNPFNRQTSAKFFYIKGQNVRHDYEQDPDSWIFMNLESLEEGIAYLTSIKRYKNQTCKCTEIYPNENWLTSPILNETKTVMYRVMDSGMGTIPNFYPLKPEDNVGCNIFKFFSSENNAIQYIKDIKFVYSKPVIHRIENEREEYIPHYVDRSHPNVIDFDYTYTLDELCNL